MSSRPSAWNKWKIITSVFSLHFSPPLVLSHQCVVLFTGGFIMRRRATAVNTVANTSRTACGSGCTCCLTQVFSNSHALSASAHRCSPYSGCGLSDAPVHPLLHPNPPPQIPPSAVSPDPDAWITLSFPRRGRRASLFHLNRSRFPFSSSFFFFWERERMAARQLCPFWVMTSWAAGRPGCSASVFRSVCDGSLADVCPGTHCTQMQT